MPSSRALAFISATKALSEPEMPSASTMQASLPDWMIMPRSRSSTRTSLPSSTNILEPPIFQAVSDTLKVVSMVISPFLSSSKTTAAVISLVIEAGGTRLSASLS